MRKNARKSSFKRVAFRRSTKRGWRIHSDLKEWPVRSKHGYKYSICFVDDATRRGKAYPMRNKDDALEMLQKFIDEECTPRGLSVSVLRSDNGGEYIGSEFSIWCRSHQLRREYSPPMCQSGNGVSESFWREVARYVRSILWDQQRGDEYWPAALDFAVEVRNHLESDVVDGSGVPEVEWTGGEVDTSHWRVPLSTTWSFIEKDKRLGGTLGDRRLKGVLVGYAEDSTCYQVYDEVGNRVLNRRYNDVVVDEREAVPRDDRVMRGSLQTIEESDEEDEAETEAASSPQQESSNSSNNRDINSDSSGAAPTTKPALVVHEPVVPTSFEHGGDEFMRLTKQQSVSGLADLFSVDPAEYLKLLKQYDGWYKDLKSVKSVVSAGSDVPIPQSVVELSESLRAPHGRAARPRNGGRAHANAHGGKEKKASATSASVGGSSSTTRRRSVRQIAAKNAAQDAAALLALAVDFERQAKAQVRASTEWTPATGPIEDTAFYIADCDPGIADSIIGSEGVFLTDTRGGFKGMTAATRACTTDNSCGLLYDDEPKDSVYFEALAAGQIPTLPDPNSAPKTQKQARSGPHRDLWIASETKEWEGLWKKGAFEDVPISGQKLHHLLWVYKVKSDGTLKSRLCADGRQQDPATYGAIASPTMRTTSFRMLLALAAMRKWDVFADDVQQAFLEALRPVDKPLYTSYPSGFKNPGHCMLVLRQLYGLHDAPMGFYECLKQHLVHDQHFVQSRNDECMFMKFAPGSGSETAWKKALEEANNNPDEAYPPPVVLGDVQVLVCVHVDDFASTGEDVALARYRKELHKRFPCTGGQICEYYGLDVRVDKEKGETSVSAESYIGRMVAKLGIKVIPKVETPMDPDLVLERLEGECKDKALQKRFRTVTGMVLHASITARPDVAAVARVLASHLRHPAEKHLRVAMRAVFYLATTRSLALTYGRYPQEAGFYGTCDASHGTEEGSKGVTGWAFHLGGGAISWKSKTQGLVAMSSTEAELIAVDDATRELRYLEKLLADVGIPAPRPTPIGQDNLSTCHLVGSTRFNPRTRHLALRYHSTGDLQRAGVLQVRHLPTLHMPSDLLTKGLPKLLHKRHTAVLLGLVALAWSTRGAKDCPGSTNQ
jgi:hypothetical protein